MPASQKKVVASKFPLRLMPSVRRVAESFSQREGVSLNQFINVAIAEKLAHLQHDEWLARRPKASDALIAKALMSLDHSNAEAEESDKIPDSYLSRRVKRSAKRASRGPVG